MAEVDCLVQKKNLVQIAQLGVKRREVEVGRLQQMHQDVKLSQATVLEEECLQGYQFPAVELTNLEARTGSLMRKVVCEWLQVQSVLQQRMNPQTQSLRHFQN